MSLLSRIINHFAWKTVRDTGVWIYQENSRTHNRRAIHLRNSGHQPCDWDWLQKKIPNPLLPPSGGSAAMRPANQKGGAP